MVSPGASPFSPACLGRHFTIMKRFAILLLVLSGCLVTQKPMVHRTPGEIHVITVDEFLGLIPVRSNVRRLESPEATKARLAREKAEKLQEIELEKKAIELKRQERQESAALWFGIAMFVCAVGCVIAGAVIQQGWKFWGFMASVFGCMGAFSWGFAAWLVYLRWACIPVVILAVFRVMHGMRDVSVAGAIKGRFATNQKQTKRGSDK